MQSTDLLTGTEFTDRSISLARTSHSMGCIDASKGIFKKFLWLRQHFSGCVKAMHAVVCLRKSLKLYLKMRSPKVVSMTLPQPPLATPQPPGDILKHTVFAYWTTEKSLQQQLSPSWISNYESQPKSPIFTVEISQYVSFSQCALDFVGSLVVY